MAGSVLVATLILAGVAVLQTNLFQVIAIAGVTPDLVLVILTYYAHRNGSMPGQISGFGVGLIEDFLSLSPLGFHAFLRTLTGFLYGLTRNKTFLDPVFMPILLVFVGTVIKGLTAGLISVVFPTDPSIPAIFSGGFLIELAYNSLTAPLVYAILSFIKPIRQAERTNVL